MDALILDLQVVCSQFLPILGAVALIFLCVLLHKLGKLVVAITKTVEDLGPTLKKVDTSVEKIQAPLNTVARLSHSVDKMQDKTSETLEKISDFAQESIQNVKEYAQNKTNGNAQETVEKEEESHGEQ